MQKLMKRENNDGSIVIEQVGARAVEQAAKVDTDTGKPARFGFFVLLIGFGGFMLWALFAPLSSGVPAGGVVSIESQRKSVQHYSGGIVEQIKVVEGDKVKAGQVLVTLNPTRARADLEIIRDQYFSARASQDRLLSEYLNQNAVRFSDDLLAHKSEPHVAQILDVQRRLFDTRRAAQQHEMAVLRESEAALKTQLTGMRDLASEGYLPRNRMLDAERTNADLQLRILQQEHEYRKQVESMLGDAQKDTANLFDRLQAAQQELDRTEIKAPVDGVVMNLAVTTIGGVVGAGGRVLDIVPENEPLIVEANIPTYLIDQVRAGMDADLRFSAFNQSRTPVIQGKVITVSADRLVDQGTHQPYYLARITVPPDQIKRLGSGNHVQPGMPVEVIVKGEPRTFMSYLLKPMMDRFASALGER